MTDVSSRGEFARALAESDYEDVLVVSRDTGARLLDDLRREILDYIESAEPTSVNELATALDRDESAVEDDLDLLIEHDIIEFEDGETLRLKHEHVVVEPLV